MPRRIRPVYKSIADAADTYSVSTKTIRRWIASGRLPAFRVGPRKIRVRVEDVDALARPIPTAPPDDNVA